MMEFVLGNLWKDLAFTLMLGAVGGFGLGLLQEKGLEMPHFYKESGINFADFGFVSDVLIGGLAAIIVYSLNQPTGILQLLSSAITAGIGGSAILKSYVKGIAAREQANRAEMYRKAAVDASMGIDVKTRLNELKKVDDLVIRRWGPR